MDGDRAGASRTKHQLTLFVVRCEKYPICLMRGILQTFDQLFGIAMQLAARNIRFTLWMSYTEMEALGQKRHLQRKLAFYHMHGFLHRPLITHNHIGRSQRSLMQFSVRC